MRERRINGKLWVNPISYLNKRDAQAKASDYAGDGFQAKVVQRKAKGHTAYDVYISGKRQPRLSR